jgi:hypothetical protein
MQTVNFLLNASYSAAIKTYPDLILLGKEVPRPDEAPFMVDILSQRLDSPEEIRSSAAAAINEQGRRYVELRRKRTLPPYEFTAGQHVLVRWDRVARATGTSSNQPTARRQSSSPPNSTSTSRMTCPSGGFDAATRSQIQSPTGRGFSITNTCVGVCVCVCVFVRLDRVCVLDLVLFAVCYVQKSARTTEKRKRSAVESCNTEAEPIPTSKL